MNLPPLPAGDCEVWSDNEQTGRPGKMRVLRSDYSAERVEAIRREAYNLALEDAAKVCEDMDEASYPHTRRWPSDCAAAIRALKGQP